MIKKLLQDWLEIDNLVTKREFDLFKEINFSDVIYSALEPYRINGYFFKDPEDEVSKKLNALIATEVRNAALEYIQQTNSSEQFIDRVVERIMKKQLSMPTASMSDNS